MAASGHGRCTTSVAPLLVVAGTPRGSAWRAARGRQAGTRGACRSGKEHAPAHERTQEVENGVKHGGVGGEGEELSPLKFK